MRPVRRGRRRRCDAICRPSGVQFRTHGVQNRGAQGAGGRRDAPRPAVRVLNCQFVISGAGGVVRLKGKLRSYVMSSVMADHQYISILPLPAR